MIAHLYTATGFAVGAVEVPAFETGYPPAIVFGARFFLRLGGAEIGTYFETFCYTATVAVVSREEARGDDDHG